MSNLNKFLTFALILAFSVMTAVYGTGYSYDRVVTPKTGHGVFKHIEGDGWIENRSSMTFRGLASRGNWARLKFNNWRPPGNSPAHIKAFLCGELVGDFLVDADNKEVKLPLSTDCEPKILNFEVVNPFVPSPSDQRELGAQVKTVTITSKIWPPIVKPFMILMVFLGTVFLSGLVWLALSGYGLGSVSIVTPLLSMYLLTHSISSDFENITALWFFFCLLFTGVWIGRIFKDTDLESDGASTLKYSLIACLVVLGAGALRFYGIRYGLPSNYHPDEVPKVNAIMRMQAQGDLNPNYFLHPSMLLYTSYGMNKLFHYFGIVDGDFRATAFLAGRTVSALTGTLSVGLLYLIGRRLFNARVGLAASAMLAVFPLHVVCSRYMKEDAQLVFWVLMTAWIVVKSVQEDKPWLYVLAGLTAGVSASVKYSGLLSAAIVAYGPWLKSRTLKPDWRWFRWGILAAVLFPLGFAACTPYSILNSEKFLKDFQSESHHMQRGHTITIDSWSQYWMYHFSRSVIPGTTWLAASLGVVGLTVMLFTRSTAGLFIFALAMLFYLPAEYVKAKPAPQPERYILPSLPFLAIGAAYLLERLRASKFKPLAALALVLVIALPLYRSWNFSSEITNDTRGRMEIWMLENLPRGSKIYLDWKRYAPEFWNNEFEITYIQRAKIMPRLDIKSLKESGQDYLVLSGLFYDRYFTQPSENAAVRQRLREVFERVPILHEMNPKYGTYGFHNPNLTLFTLDKEAFAKLEEELRRKKAGEIEQTSNDKKTKFKWFVD